MPEPIKFIDKLTHCLGLTFPSSPGKHPLTSYNISSGKATSAFSVHAGDHHCPVLAYILFVAFTWHLSPPWICVRSELPIQVLVPSPLAISGRLPTPLRVQLPPAFAAWHESACTGSQKNTPQHMRQWIPFRIGL